MHSSLFFLQRLETVLLINVHKRNTAVDLWVAVLIGSCGMPYFAPFSWLSTSFLQRLDLRQLINVHKRLLSELGGMEQEKAALEKKVRNRYVCACFVRRVRRAFMLELFQNMNPTIGSVEAGGLCPVFWCAVCVVRVLVLFQMLSTAFASVEANSTCPLRVCCVGV